MKVRARNSRESSAQERHMYEPHRALSWNLTLHCSGNMLTYGVLGCQAVQFGRQVPMFRKKHFLHFQGRNT